MIPLLVRRRAVAAALGCLSFLAIGWSSLLMPALALEIEAGFGQTDVGLGFFYFMSAAAYAIGSVFGGMATERVGRRMVLVLAVVLHALGLAAQGGPGSWEIFIVAGVVRSIGAGAMDGGANALVIDLYPESKGRALNLGHFFFALGALGAPFIVAASGSIGVPWQSLVVASGLVTLPLALLLAVTELPHGRRRAVAGVERLRSRALGLPLVVLAIAIGCYVAGEIGVSNWLVRFLAAAPVGVATSTLGLYWAGLTVGRLAAARFADRFDHVALGILAAAATSIALVAAVIAPSLELSVALFVLVGIASGPIYPLIMAIGGERFPDRAAAMSGILSGAAVLGSLVYPPLMGLLSVTVGLPVAMIGTAVIGSGTVVALVIVGRMPAADARVAASPDG